MLAVCSGIEEEVAVGEQESRFETCARIIERARAMGRTVGTAESCTGGLVCGALTEVAGSSVAVMGGIVSYAVPVKESVLHVPTSVSRDPNVGVVSSECARDMCKGARKVLNCDVAVSVTGIAGPGGEEPGKPVGTVWFGIATPKGVRTNVRHFDGNRSEVRSKAVDYALSLLCAALNEDE